MIIKYRYKEKGTILITIFTNIKLYISSCNQYNFNRVSSTFRIWYIKQPEVSTKR